MYVYIHICNILSSLVETVFMRRHYESGFCELYFKHTSIEVVMIMDSTSTPPPKTCTTEH